MGTTFDERELVTVLLIGFVYFLPVAIARLRGLRAERAIGVLTLFTGWTVIGWVGALVWAFAATDTRHDRDHHRGATTP